MNRFSFMNPLKKNRFIIYGLFYKRTIKKSVHKKDHNYEPIIKNRFINNQFPYNRFINPCQAGPPCGKFQLLDIRYLPQLEAKERNRSEAKKTNGNSTFTTTY